jgi:hypothetical protein
VNKVEIVVSDGWRWRCHGVRESSRDERMELSRKKLSEKEESCHQMRQVIIVTDGTR